MRENNLCKKLYSISIIPVEVIENSIYVPSTYKSTKSYSENVWIYKKKLVKKVVPYALHRNKYETPSFLKVSHTKKKIAGSSVLHMPISYI